MKVMIFVKSDESSEAGCMPSTELLTAMAAFNQKLIDAGVMLDGDGLRPSKDGVRIRFGRNDRGERERTVIDGPFTESKELVAGYWVWKVGSMAEAIDWLKRAPFEDAELEIRPFMEADDFGEAFTPELREQEERQRRQIQGEE